MGIGVALLGLILPALRVLYDYAWFVGFGVSGAVYLLLMQRATGTINLPEWEDEA